MDLPLQLAISLLKGPDGNIEVELPIEGRVDDPKFRIGGIIWKALRIVAQSTHDALVRDNPLYARLAELQFSTT